jgi:uncharacterized protein (DUF2267 family)
MSANGLEVFDKTLQTTHIWLDEIMQAIGPDRKVAWKVLSTVLHKLRDRLSVDLAAHLGAELPLLIRGVYYDQYHPARQPTRCELGEFIEEVNEWLRDTRPVDPRVATRAVFATLSAHIPRGQIAKVQDALPKGLRAFWISAEEGIVPPPEQGEAGRYGEPRSFSEAEEERVITMDDIARRPERPSDETGPATRI